MRVVLIIFCVFFQSCFSANTLRVGRIQTEDDIVYDVKRHRIEFRHHRTLERVDRLIELRQTVVKEIDRNASESYQIYENIKLNSGFRIDEDKVFIIIDDSPFQLKLESLEANRSTRIEEKREDILKADSSTVSVVTAYNQKDILENRITYKLPQELVDRIKGAEKVKFRYYSGPDMLTIPFSQFYLKGFKKLINLKTELL